jgi:hypothetical protein
MMEAVRTSETSVDNHFTRQYIPEDNSEQHTRRRENLKSHSTKWGIHKGKRSETIISSIILYFLRGSQEHYSETALSEAHYSDRYLYLHLDLYFNRFTIIIKII